MKSNKNKGFTLTELLTTTAVISVLASLMLPAISKVKHKVRDVQCLNNQRNMQINLRSAYSDINPSYESRMSVEDSIESRDNFFRHYIGAISPDPYLGHFGVSYARTLTCPYAFGDGKKRAFFNRIPTFDEPVSSTVGPAKKYITKTYRYQWDEVDPFTLGDQINSPKEIVLSLSHMLENPGFEEKTVITFTDSVLHPHKGIGSYLTRSSGEQRWFKRKELTFW